MKTAVTGGTGFIGSHVVKKLLEQGRQVIIVADFARLGTENLENLGIKSSDVEFRKVDLTEYCQTQTALEGIDTVFHLAAVVGNLQFLHGTETAELLTLQRNLSIDTNVFRVCQEKGVKRLLYASSCAVYPMERQYGHEAVFVESDFTASNPDGGYGWSKLMAEMQLGWMNGIEIGIARIYSAYGQNEPIDEGRAHAIGDLTRKIILDTHGEIIVYGDGTQSRDFLYASDCADAFLRLEEKATTPPIIVNIGSGKPVSIGSVAEKLVAISGKHIKIRYDSSRPTGPVSRTADITHAKNILGWNPSVSIDDGLKMIFTWAKSKLEY